MHARHKTPSTLRSENYFSNMPRKQEQKQVCPPFCNKQRCKANVLRVGQDKQKTMMEEYYENPGYGGLAWNTLSFDHKLVKFVFSLVSILPFLCDEFPCWLRSKMVFDSVPIDSVITLHKEI